jgi:hypothetical protein
MKKILLLFAIALCVVSCQDEAPQSSKIINVQINASDWLSYNDSVRSCKFYYYNSSVPELSSAVFKSGSVSAFVVDSTSEKTLPYIIKAETAGTNWKRSTTYSYSEGKIVFYVVYPSLNSNPPDVLNFRVVISE